MKFFYTLLIIAISAPLLSKAQSNFKPGYVVTLNGDTLKGFIDYREWGKTPRQVNFKISENKSRPEQYSAINTLAFGITGFEHYRRFILSISMDAVETSKLPVGIDTTRITDTTFLKVIAAGKNVTLYNYRDQLKERFFLSEGVKLPTELIRHLYLNTDQTNRIQITDTYKRQLQRMANLYQPQSKTLLGVIQAVSYNSNELQKIADDINGADHIKTYRNASEGFRFFAGIGTNISLVNFKGQYVLTAAKASSILPKINAGIDVYFNRNIRKWLFRAELDLTMNKSNFVYTGYANTLYTQSIRFDQYIAFINPQIIYNIYDTKNVKLYLGAGIAINYSKCTNKQNQVDYYVNGAVINSTKVDFPDPQAIYYSITTKAGFTINNKLDIYAGYNPPTAITNYVNYNMNLSSYQVGINYLFGKK